MQNVKTKATTKFLAGQKKTLNRGKVKHLGLIETIRMQAAGKRDGKDGLPKKTPSGSWDSPRLRQENSAYSENCCRQWGLTELELADSYTEAGALVAKINRYEARMERLLREAPAQPDDSYFTSRRDGEEDLSQCQIQKRRTSELDKQNAPYRARIKAMESEIDTAYSRLDELHSSISETNNTTRLICSRMKDHAEQLIAAYWRAAYRNRSGESEMSAVPEPLRPSKAEYIYLAQHKELVHEAVAMLASRERLLSMQEEKTTKTKINIGKEVA